MDPTIPVAEVVELSGYAVPVGAEHLPSTLAFLEYVSSPQAQLLVAQTLMSSSAHYVPARRDVDSESLSAAQIKGLTLINEVDETVHSFEFGVPPQMLGSVDPRFKAFVRKPEDIESFISKVEEARQQMVDQGLLLTE